MSVIVLSSCSDTDLKFEEIVGEWQLIETNLDPGDGSGVFTPVNSNRTITFKSNGTFTSKGDLCELNTSSTGTSNGVYNEANETMTIDSCTGVDNNILYELVNKNLILNYTCIEACQHKYEKISD